MKAVCGLRTLLLLALALQSAVSAADRCADSLSGDEAENIFVIPRLAGKPAELLSWVRRQLENGLPHVSADDKALAKAGLDRQASAIRAHIRRGHLSTADFWDFFADALNLASGGDSIAKPNALASTFASGRDGLMPIPIFRDALLEPETILRMIARGEAPVQAPDDAHTHDESPKVPRPPASYAAHDINHVGVVLQRLLYEPQAGRCRPNGLEEKLDALLDALNACALTRTERRFVVAVLLEVLFVAPEVRTSDGRFIDCADVFGARSGPQDWAFSDVGARERLQRRLEIPDALRASFDRALEWLEVTSRME